MIVNAIVLVLILLITMYLSTQGMLSSLLALATATFSSVLAMALMEPLQSMIAGFWPDRARGLTMLLLFLIVFAVTRFGADAVVTKNIKLSLWVNRIAGGVVGFFTALVVVGTLINGIEMMPVGRAYLGYDRFPGDKGMQALDADGKPVNDEVSIAKQMNGIWFGPDRFVQKIWSSASRSFDGSRPWGTAHPDLSIESYGYRNNVSSASERTLAPDLLTVSAAWANKDASFKDDAGTDHKAETGKKFVMVRTEIDKGDKPPHASVDPNDNYFRISATQIRLVTKVKDGNAVHQYYPVGVLENGRTFSPMPLDRGHLVEDYANSGKVVEDWLFQVPEDEDAQAVEVKQFARKEIAGIVSDKMATPLARGAYPPRGYLKDLSNLEVTFDPKGQKLLAGHVYVLTPGGLKRDFASEYDAGFDNVNEILKNISSGGAGWSNTKKPGVPDPTSFQYANSKQANDIRNEAPDQSRDWMSVVPVILLGQAQPNGDANVRDYPDLFEQHVEQMWKKSSQGNAILGVATADESGHARVSKILAGSHGIVVTMQTDKGFFVWIKSREFKGGDSEPITASRTGGEAPQFAVDMESAAAP